jgi:demethylmenaquinone methyltransferase / 2-methoxy-6-polyprenyl-1,4-benzoquinol methylase
VCVTGLPTERKLVPPHPLMSGHYASLDERSAFVRALFDRAARDYDQINRIVSFGSGSRYRRQALRRAGLRPGMRVLDVAIGTGLVAREAIRLTGHRDRIVGLDVSENMLALARRSIGVAVVQARGEALPFASASMDFVSMGYALRHVSDLALAFHEVHRVLRPGGIVLLLEIGRPDGRAAHGVARLYLGRIVPALCHWFGRSEARELMRYYWDTIEACVPASAILDTLRYCGFADASCETSLGIFRAYTATRP